MKNKTGNRLVIGALLFILIGYNGYMYFSETTASSKKEFSINALEGQKIWQDNNCTACHQLYGLGGYLGPDLTNIISNPKKGEVYTKAFFNSGINSMPKFNFSENEKNKLISFLTEVDQTGYYPNINAEFSYSGWVDIKYK